MAPPPSTLIRARVLLNSWFWHFLVYWWCLEVNVCLRDVLACLDDLEEFVCELYRHEGAGKPPRNPLGILKALIVKHFRNIPSDMRARKNSMKNTLRGRVTRRLLLLCSWDASHSLFHLKRNEPYRGEKRYLSWRKLNSLERKGIVGLRVWWVGCLAFMMLSWSVFHRSAHVHMRDSAFMRSYARPDHEKKLVRPTNLQNRVAGQHGWAPQTFILSYKIHARTEILLELHRNDEL